MEHGIVSCYNWTLFYVVLLASSLRQEGQPVENLNVVHHHWQCNCHPTQFYKPVVDKLSRHILTYTKKKLMLMTAQGRNGLLWSEVIHLVRTLSENADVWAISNFMQMMKSRPIVSILGVECLTNFGYKNPSLLSCRPWEVDRIICILRVQKEDQGKQLPHLRH